MPNPPEGSLWSFRLGDTIVTYYPSGALSLHGKEEGEVAQRILNLVGRKTVIGCDEAGKGELFGPLVACCVCIPAGNYPRVLMLNPRDSKRLSEKRLERLVNSLRTLVKVRCREIFPEEYNRMYPRYGNINSLLTATYRDLLDGLKDCRAERIVVDAYGKKNPFGKGIIFTEKGERYPEVSVASIFARWKYLKGLEKLQRVYGLKIPRGSGKEAKELARTLKEKEKLIKLNFNI